MPGAPPEEVRAFAESSTSIRVVWSPPPASQQNGNILYYKIFYVKSSKADSEAIELRIQSDKQKGNSNEYVIDELQKFTEYRLWINAGTKVGDGPSSYPVLTKTDEDGKSTALLSFSCTTTADEPLHTKHPSQTKHHHHPWHRPLLLMISASS